MPNIYSNPSEKKIQPPSGAAIETFSDLLADALDLEGLCSTALQFALETIDHTAGLLMVQSPQDSQVVCLVQQNLSKKWQVQLNDPSSPLYLIAQEVLQSGQYVRALKSVSGGSQLMDITDLAIAIAIPAQTRQTTNIIQGVLIVQGAPCSPVEIDWLNKLARPLGRAIRMSRSSRSGLQQTKTLASLQETLNNLSMAADLEKLHTQLMSGISHLLDADNTVLALLDDLHPTGKSQTSTETRWITRKAQVSADYHVQGTDARSGWVHLVDPFDGDGLVRECLRSAQPIRVNHPEMDPRFNPAVDSLPGLPVQSVLLAPLVTNEHLIGAIEVLNKHSGDFSQQDQDLLMLIANLASNAVYNAQMMQRMKIADADQEAERWELASAYTILKTLFVNLPGQIYVVGQQNELIAMNLEYRRALEQRSGRSWSEMIGKTCYQALYDRQEPCPGCLVAETFHTGRPTVRNLTRPVGVNQDMTSSWEIHTYPIFDDRSMDLESYMLQNRVTQVILLEQDISERRELESVIAQSGKLAALGQLAAGVAHEINNPLTAIIANAQILQRELSPDDEMMESVELISMAGTRAAQMVRNLLDFARKEQIQRVLTDVNDTMRAALSLVQHELLKHAITLEFDMDEQLPAILASPDSLQGVWLNLMLNAIESIDVETAANGKGRIRIITQREGDQIVVKIIDNGRGIPKERVGRIFEPFFTTKPHGRGTGLGLSVCRRIVEQHNGAINVESQIGVGTEFKVLLPVS